MARDPKTKPQAMPTGPEDLPQLTSNEFGYVKARLEGMNQSDAYRASYSVENMSDPAIWVEASRVDARPNVSLWLARARDGQLIDAKVTLESHTRELRRLAGVCETTGNMGASVKATELMGRVNGLYVDVIETRNPDAKALIEQIMQLPEALRGPVLAEAGLSESDLELPTQH